MRESRIIKAFLALLLTLTFLLSWTLPSGAVIYTYDDLGRLTTATYPNGETLYYTYDAGGNLLSMSFTDNSPPTVSGTDPANNASSVTVDKTITVTFNESVVQGVYFSNIMLKNDLNGLSVSYTASVSEKNLTIDPTSNLGYGIPYVVTVPVGAVNDINGNALAADYAFSFNTEEDSAPPTVSSTNPADRATGVSVSALVYVTFSESVVEDVYFSDINIKNTFDSSVVESTYSLSGDLLTIDPFNDLNYSVTYAVYIPAGAVKDMTGNSLESAYSFTFTTGITQDTTPPTVTYTDPSNGETGVAIYKVINITFSEAIQQGDYFNEINLSLGGDTVSSATYISGNSLTIDPDTSLGYSSNYTVTIPAGSVKDGAGNSLAGVYSFSFTTSEAQGDTIAPTWPAGSALTATPNSAGGSVALSWPEATDNVGVTGYNVYNGTTLLTPTPITAVSYDVTGLTTGLYTFTVKAVDAAGNASDPLSSDALVRAKGDVNGDGAVNNLDLSLTTDIILHRYTPTSEEIYAADIDDNSKINSFDYIKIVNIILQREP